ncbi:MAG: hypothetical protein PF495_01650 [Spirochaetales bacterium]|jgi:predicted DNA-binding ribbon-helix-helix protein|nr:hypothetical protein [Spirochaetales bacterium]
MAYSKLRVWLTTNRKLKIMAAVKGITVIQLIENLVDAEEKRDGN